MFPGCGEKGYNFEMRQTEVMVVTASIGPHSLLLCKLEVDVSV